MTADGILTQKNGKDTLEVSTRFEHFPLKMANAFIPDQMVAFTGDIDGGVNDYAASFIRFRICSALSSTNLMMRSWYSVLELHTPAE